MLSPVRLASIGVSMLITLGCGNPPAAPWETPTPPRGPEPSASQRLAALALFDAAGVHAFLTTSLLTYGTDDGKVLWTNGPCAFGQGSMQGALDGGLTPTPGTLLPTGSHTYVVTFSNCPVNYWGNEAFELDGVASVAYSTAEWKSDLSAMVSADSVRGREFGARSGLNDVTADGSGVWTRSSHDSTTYTPATGSRLVNNSTSSVARFGGGSYSLIRSSSQGTPSRSHRFDNLKVTVNGTEYTLNGSLIEISASSITYAGEIRITTDGMLVARIYGDGGNDLRVEVLVPLVPL
jgi:hypothetical protein